MIRSTCVALRVLIRDRHILMVWRIPIDEILGSHGIEIRSSRRILTSQTQHLQIRPPDYIARGKQTGTPWLVGATKLPVPEIVVFLTYVRGIGAHQGWDVARHKPELDLSLGISARS